MTAAVAADWHIGTVVELVAETPQGTSIVLNIPGWGGRACGQRVELYLSADDRHQPSRSYAIASAPEDGYVVLRVHRIHDEELFAHWPDRLKVGHALRLRGPIDGSLVWDVAEKQPTQLVAGGFGVVPFRRCCATARRRSVLCRSACCTRLARSTMSSTETS